MAKSNLTLVVDGNWLLMSRMSVINNRYADEIQMCHELKLMMIKSINVVLRQFPLIDNIIFVADGGSWRNDLEKPSFMVDEYKGNREPDPNFDWKLFFSKYEDFIATLNVSGVTAVREPGIEGDDWAWYWSRKLNSEGTNVIIWTKDKDLTQLVQIDKNKCFTVWWNKDTGCIAPISNEEEMDFLFNPQYNQNEDLLKSITSKSKDVINIDPKTVILDKIIRGDAGDNIFPVVQRKAKAETSMRLYKVSMKDIDFTLDIHNEDEIRTYFTNLLSSKTYLGRVDKSVNQVVEHFLYNVKLVTLEKESYPQEILDKFAKYTDYNLSKDLSIAESEISAQSNNIESILNVI